MYIANEASEKFSIDRSRGARALVGTKGRNSVRRCFLKISPARKAIEDLLVAGGRRNFRDLFGDLSRIARVYLDVANVEIHDGPREFRFTL